MERKEVIASPDSFLESDWARILSGIYNTPSREAPVVIPAPEPGNEFVLALRQPARDWGLVIEILDLMDNVLGFWERPYAARLSRLNDVFIRDGVMGFFGIRRPRPDPLPDRLARLRADLLRKIERLQESLTK